MTREEMKEMMVELLREVHRELHEEMEAERAAQLSEKEGRLLRLLSEGPRTRNKLQRNNNFTANELDNMILSLNLEQYRDTDPASGSWVWFVKVR